MEIDRIDHIVLTVSDVEETIRFYTEVLGMRAVTFGDGRRALAFGGQKINLHQAGSEFEPKAAHPTPGSADFCLVTRKPLGEIMEHLVGRNVEVLQGPVERTGALGVMESVYIRDPDGNLVELSCYPHGGEDM
ncbi:MAG: VOC family protein [Rubrobacteraceae bacterium]|nr:VOC family protein [Rubrobacter sp.]